MKTKKKIEKTDWEQVAKKQNDKIEDLRKENDRLEKEVRAYREKEAEIMKTLAFARKTGEEYVTLIKMQYAMESDRIGRFRQKLQKYRNREDLLRAYDDSFRELKGMQEELARSAEKGLGSVLKDYYEEKERIGDNVPDESLEPIRKTDLSHADKITDEDLRDLLDQLNG